MTARMTELWNDAWKAAALNTAEEPHYSPATRVPLYRWDGVVVVCDHGTLDRKRDPLRDPRRCRPCGETQLRTAYPGVSLSLNRRTLIVEVPRVGSVHAERHGKRGQITNVDVKSAASYSPRAARTLAAALRVAADFAEAGEMPPGHGAPPSQFENAAKR